MSLMNLVCWPPLACMGQVFIGASEDPCVLNQEIEKLTQMYIPLNVTGIKYSKKEHITRNQEPK